MFPPSPRTAAATTSTSRMVCGLAVALAAAVSVGCSPGGVPISGQVLFDDGEPVRSGRIEFRHRETRHRGMGTIDDQGQYDLADMDGGRSFRPGTYDVIVVQMIITRDLTLQQHDHGRPVPRSFADYDTSGLQADIGDSPARVSIRLPP